MKLSELKDGDAVMDRDGDIWVKVRGGWFFVTPDMAGCPSDAMVQKYAPLQLLEVGEILESEHVAD